MSLSQYRSYEALDAEFGPGLTVLHGENGQGKSNLLEALYLLAVAKSSRAGADRELMRRDASGQPSGHTQVSAWLSRGEDTVRVQFDLSVSAEEG
ncbi:MAG: AAA family ATPase, partial [Chloroflexi bacterium]|nr:AAA family ATPase [Chloroflexota bacterium]